MDIERDFRAEVLRKAVHLSSIAMPAIYFFVSRSFALWVLIPLTLAFLAVDLARHFHSSTATLFYRVAGSILRRRERDPEAKRLNSASWFFMAATFCVALMPKFVVVTSFAIQVFADGAAALIGRRFGHRRFRGRSVEGSLAFLTVALIVVATLPKIEYRPGEYLLGSCAALVGAATEALSSGFVDDNASVPVATGAALWLLYGLVYPGMNLRSFGPAF
jgi:dolichol kinase